MNDLEKRIDRVESSLAMLVKHFIDFRQDLNPNYDYGYLDRDLKEFLLDIDERDSVREDERLRKERMREE